MKNFLSSILIGSLLLLAACGGDSGTGPSTQPIVTLPPAPVTSVLLEGSAKLDVRVLGTAPFHTTATGTIEAHVDWTFADSTIYVYISKGECSIAQINSSQCNFLAVSETKTPKPRIVSVPNAAAGDYTLYVGNIGPKKEAVSFQVLLTTTGTTSSRPATILPSSTTDFTNLVPIR